jgi:GNAT superfamily N-acetyltransferase
MAHSSETITVGREAPDGDAAQSLIRQLDQDLCNRYPEMPVHLIQGIRPSDLADPDFTFLIARIGGRPVGCGALRNLHPGIGEVKRMYVLPAFRRYGVARRILAALEARARELSHVTLRLETGKRQPEAVHLYTTSGYRLIVAYGQWAESEHSICFEKQLLRQEPPDTKQIHALDIQLAQSGDLERYLDLLEELAAWLDTRGIRQWPPGNFRLSAGYYARSIEKQEVFLARAADELAATIRLLLHDPIVWPEVADDDAIYVYNLAVKRAWAGRGLGGRLLEWAGTRAASLGKAYVRLDSMAASDFLRDYYTRAGFEECGEVEALYPQPVGPLRLRRYEKRILDDKDRSRKDALKAPRKL